MPSMNGPIGNHDPHSAHRLSSEGATPESGPRLPSGVRVQVRNRFDGAWASGFQLLAAQPSGYLVRRLSDRAVLPVAFAERDIRLDPVPLPVAQGAWPPPAVA
jgi:hypothetical protein